MLGRLPNCIFSIRRPKVQARTIEVVFVDDQTPFVKNILSERTPYLISAFMIKRGLYIDR